MSLKSKLAAAVAAANALPPGALKAGDMLAAFDVVDAAGQSTQVEFGGRQATLLLVFSSTCGACRETIPMWNRLLAEAPSTAVHVVGIQTDFQQTAGKSESAALSVPDLRFPVFGSANPQGELLSKFPMIPGAALVDATGAVKAVWFGTPTEAQASELRHALAG
jgi:thiol-disulfide isomerase/thioredoxin